MDYAKTLIRTVARSFYEDRHILVIDALFIHSVLHADDLAVLLGMQQKDLRKLCGRLREDRMLAVATRVESRDGIQRAVPREYYYIPLHTVVDQIKYRVMKITQTVASQYVPSAERKDYICRRCGSSWTQMEVLDNVGPEGFECHRCGAVLELNEAVNGTSGAGHEKQARLMVQLKSILDLLKKIDNTEIPTNTFEEAWDQKMEIRRDQTNPSRPSLAVGSGITVAKSGPRNNESDADQLKIKLTTGAEKSKAELLEEEEKKTKLAHQNQLPVWHTQSTVTGGSFVGTQEGRDVNGAFNKAEAEADEKKGVRDADDELEKYYAEMAEEQELEKEREAAMAVESPEDDGDEDDFEDVAASTGTGTPAAVGTPMSSQPAVTNGATSGLKRELESESGSSAPTTNAPTPITGGANTPAGEEEAEQDTKRIKLDGSQTAPEVKLAEIPQVEEDSEEDEGDFEEVI